MRKERIDRRRRRFYEEIDMLKHGYTHQEMAEELGVSVRTIKKDIKFIKDNQPEKE